MGMVVRTNTMALNAYRQLGMNNSAVSKSLEKLSSGFRINRAGDDAAGLAISEKMKAQITGLETASSNAQDGISLIQTAEGNLNEVHSMLNRMVELATKSANGTYTDIERKALQDEVDSLLEEIDRISQSANFNGTNLLDGSLGNVKGEQSIVVTPQATDATTSSLGGNLISKNTVNHRPAGTAAATNKQSFYIGNGSELVNNSTGAGTITISYNYKDSTGATGNSTVVISIAAKDATDGVSSIKNNNGLVAAISAAANSVAATVTDSNVSTASGNAGVTAVDNGDGKFKDLFNVSINAHGELVIEAKNPGEGNNVTSVAYAGFDPEDTAKITKINEELTGSANDATHSDTLTDASKDHGTVYALGTELEGEGHKVVGADDAQKNYVRASAELNLANVANNTAIKVGDKIYVFQKEGEELSADATTKGSGTTGEVIKFTDAADAATKLAAALDKADNKIAATASGNTISLIEDNDSAIANSAIAKDEDLTKIDFSKLIEDVEIETAAATASTDIALTDKLSTGVKVTIEGKTFEFQTKADQVSEGNIFVEYSSDPAKNAENLAKAYNTANSLSDGDAAAATASGNTVTIGKAIAEDKISGAYRGLTLQIGDTADAFNKMSVAINDMSAKGLKLNDLSILSEDDSSDAIQRIKDAINTVSSARAGMGALQNRLEHTINNLDVAVENLNAANSRIRDTDMAKEMMNYTKMNVLVQSAQAMLAQANQQPQSVLQLLQ